VVSLDAALLLLPNLTSKFALNFDPSPPPLILIHVAITYVPVPYIMHLTAVLGILVVYPGSKFFIPDPGQKIPDPGSRIRIRVLELYYF
jgi:hypothetical protein